MLMCMRDRVGELPSSAGASQGESGVYSSDRSRHWSQLRPTGVSTELQRRLWVHHATCRHCRYRWQHHDVVRRADWLPLASSTAEHHAAVLLRYRTSQHSLSQSSYNTIQRFKGWVFQPGSSTPNRLFSSCWEVKKCWELRDLFGWNWSDKLTDVQYNNN